MYRLKHIRLGLLLGMLTLPAGGLRPATRAAEVAAPARRANHALHAAKEGSVVYLDAAGRPTLPGPDTPPAAAPPLRRGGGATASELVIQDAPGGGEMLMVGDRFRNYSVAHRTARRGVVIECTRAGTAAARTAPVQHRVQ